MAPRQLLAITLSLDSPRRQRTGDQTPEDARFTTWETTKAPLLPDNCSKTASASDPRARTTHKRRSRPSRWTRMLRALWSSPALTGHRHSVASLRSSSQGRPRGQDRREEPKTFSRLPSRPLRSATQLMDVTRVGSCSLLSGSTTSYRRRIIASSHATCHLYCH